MKHNKKFILLWVIFLVYFFCCMTMKMSYWVLLSVWSVGLAVYILIKLKLPSKKGITASIVFALLVSVAYLGLKPDLKTVLTYGITSGIPTLLCSLAVFSVKEKNYGIKIISSEKRSSPFVSVMIGIISGAVLSVINYLMMKGSNTVDFGIEFSRFVVCLNPAIFEETVCRAMFLAFGLYAVGEEKATKFRQFTIWFMMCFPHTLAHGYDIVSTIILCVLFGLPFAVLQRKRDITSAMVSHGVVDAVRFTIFGFGL